MIQSKGRKFQGDFRTKSCGVDTVASRACNDLNPASSRTEFKIMPTTTPIGPGIGAKAKLRLFSLYADYPAGIRARRVAGQIKALAGHNWEISAEMWKLDSVAPIGPIREMIAQEAGESEVLLIAVSAADQHETALAEWLNSLLDWKVNQTIPGLLVGLLGDEDHKMEETNCTVELLAAFAQRTQMNLVWQAMGSDSMDSRWLAGCVERLLERGRIGLA
jgi:hypothetical protein